MYCHLGAIQRRLSDAGGECGQAAPLQDRELAGKRGQGAMTPKIHWGISVIFLATAQTVPDPKCSFSWCEPSCTVSPLRNAH